MANHQSCWRIGNRRFWKTTYDWLTYDVGLVMLVLERKENREMNKKTYDSYRFRVYDVGAMNKDALERN